MIYNQAIETARLCLRTLPAATLRYVEWLQDERVNRYLETRHTPQDFATVDGFVQSVNASPDSYLFAIHTKEGDKHIGNIKIGPIHPIYLHAFIGYVIGEPEEWGKGYATEAIAAVCDFAFDVLGLHKVSAGVIDGNEGSAKALVKLGFTREATLRDEVLADGVYRDCFHFGLLNGERIR